MDYSKIYELNESTVSSEDLLMLKDVYKFIGTVWEAKKPPIRNPDAPKNRYQIRKIEITIRGISCKCTDPRSNSEGMYDLDVKELVEKYNLISMNG